MVKVFKGETKVSLALPLVLGGAWAQLKTEKSFFVLSGSCYGGELVLFSVETGWMRTRLCSRRWCSTSLCHCRKVMCSGFLKSF